MVRGFDGVGTSRGHPLRSLDIFIVRYEDHLKINVSAGKYVGMCCSLLQGPKRDAPPPINDSSLLQNTPLRLCPLKYVDCIWIKDLVDEKEMELNKLEDPPVLDH